MENIVRAEARKLRIRLARYYASEGIADRVRFEFPKGSYAPSILTGPATAESAATVHAAVSPDADHAALRTELDELWSKSFQNRDAATVRTLRKGVRDRPAGRSMMMKVGSLISGSLTVAVRKMRRYRDATVRERTMVWRARDFQRIGCPC